MDEVQKVAPEMLSFEFDSKTKTASGQVKVGEKELTYHVGRKEIVSGMVKPQTSFFGAPAAELASLPIDVAELERRYCAAWLENEDCQRAEDIARAKRAYDESPLHQAAEILGGKVTPDKETAYAQIESGQYFAPELKIDKNEDGACAAYQVFYSGSTFLMYGGWLHKDHKAKRAKRLLTVMEEDFAKIKEECARKRAERARAREETATVEKFLGQVDFTGNHTYACRAGTLNIAFRYDAETKEAAIDYIHGAWMPLARLQQLIAFLREGDS